MAVIEKVFTGVLLDSLIRWMNKNHIVTENQAGFRKTYSTVDNIFSLFRIIHLKSETPESKIYVFDRVERGALCNVEFYPSRESYNGKYII